MLIMCEVVSNECETLPPPPSQFLSPKEKRKRDVGRDREGQKKGRKERWNERRKEVKKEEE